MEVKEIKKVFKGMANLESNSLEVVTEYLNSCGVTDGREQRKFLNRREDLCRGLQ